MFEIKAHGKTYSDLESLMNRIAEIQVENIISGFSDGRTTELNAIIDALGLTTATPLEDRLSAPEPVLVTAHARILRPCHCDYSFHPNGC